MVLSQLAASCRDVYYNRRLLVSYRRWTLSYAALAVRVTSVMFLLVCFCDRAYG